MRFFRVALLARPEWLYKWNNEQIKSVSLTIYFLFNCIFLNTHKLYLIIFTLIYWLWISSRILQDFQKLSLLAMLEQLYKFLYIWKNLNSDLIFCRPNGSIKRLVNWIKFLYNYYITISWHYKPSSISVNWSIKFLYDYYVTIFWYCRASFTSAYWSQ